MAKSPRTLITVPGAARAQVFAEMAGKPQPLEFGDYVRILRERWFAMVVAMLIMLIGAGCYTLSATPVFVAKATLFVTATSADDTAYENSQFARQRVASYPDIVDSPEVLDKVVEDLSLEMTASALAGHVTAVNPKDTVLLEVSADADDAARAAEIANATAKGLGMAIEKVETSPRAGGMTVKAALMVPATAPAIPDAPRPLINFALAMVLGLSSGIIAALFLDRGERRIRRAADIERDFNLGVVGEVKASVDPEGLDRADRTAYREMAANLALINDGAIPQRTLLVSVGEEPAQQHGAVALGRVLADLGRRVCLVDGDAAAVPLLGNRPSSPGVGEVLCGEVEADDAMQRLDHLAMAYLPAGSPGSALRRHDVARQASPFLDAIGGEHDAVVLSTRFDAEPLDASLLAPYADCVLLVCLARGTLRMDLAATLKELTAVHVVPAGVVLIHDAPRPARRRGRRSGSDR